MDDYGTDAERAAARRQDDVDDWTVVPDEQIAESPMQSTSSITKGCASIYPHS